MHLTSLLKTLRSKKGLTQIQMGEKLKLHSQFYNKIENGKARLPLTHVKKIAGILDYPPELICDAIVKDFERRVLSTVRGK